MSNILFYCLSKIFYSASIPSVNSSPGFMVLTRRKKYNRWHAHTTARQILPTGTFFMQINPIAITTVTVPTILHFVPIVMALFWTKLSRCFLYKFVPMNQSCSFFELLAKQNSVAMKNGTVGRIGSTIPIVPSPRQRNPSTIQTIFNGFFIFFLFSCGSSLHFCICDSDSIFLHRQHKLPSVYSRHAKFDAIQFPNTFFCDHFLRITFHQYHSVFHSDYVV